MSTQKTKKISKRKTSSAAVSSKKKPVKSAIEVDTGKKVMAKKTPSKKRRRAKAASGRSLGSTGQSTGGVQGGGTGFGKVSSPRKRSDPKKTSRALRKWVDDANKLIVALDVEVDYDALKGVWEDLYSLKENIGRKIQLFRQIDSKRELDLMFRAGR